MVNASLRSKQRGTEKLRDKTNHSDASSLGLNHGLDARNLSREKWNNLLDQVKYEIELNVEGSVK